MLLLMCLSSQSGANQQISRFSVFQRSPWMHPGHFFHPYTWGKKTSGDVSLELGQFKTTNTFKPTGDGVSQSRGGWARQGEPILVPHASRGSLRIWSDSVGELADLKPYHGVPMENPLKSILEVQLRKMPASKFLSFMKSRIPSPTCNPPAPIFPGRKIATVNTLLLRQVEPPMERSGESNQWKVELCPPQPFHFSAALPKPAWLTFLSTSADP